MDITSILNSIKDFFYEILLGIENGFVNLQDSATGGHAYTAVVRWIFIGLAGFILVKAIFSLLRSKIPYEVWSYFNINGEHSEPITHWENVVGRQKSSDLVIKDKSVAKSQGVLIRDERGKWHYLDVSKDSRTLVKGKPLGRTKREVLEYGDELTLGNSTCTIYPISLEERRNNEELRRECLNIEHPWISMIALTIFQILTIIQLKVSLGNSYSPNITISFLLISIAMWGYVLISIRLKRHGFEMEIIAFFLSTLSLAITASKFPSSSLKQGISVLLGLVTFVIIFTLLGNLNRAKKLQKYIYGLCSILLVFNIIFGRAIFGAANWVVIGGISIQPSEIVKLGFIWVGAASLDQLMEKKNSLIFTGFSFFCFLCLALMGDFGTALIFFVTFLVISFLRSGDFTKIILISGAAVIGGLLALKFKSYIANRFSVWGHVWEHPNELGFQQTRTMSASASGGLIGVGAGSGWLKSIPASETDLVFGFLTEEWGLIIACLAVLCIISFTIFAVRSIYAGRSTFYTIAACSAMSMFIFQTMLNVFGALDLFPLTGVTMPFVSSGGTSMIASWGLLGFLKSADTRENLQEDELEFFDEEEQR